MIEPLSLGLCLHREQPASAVVEHARVAEEAGFDELWVVEDCFYTAGPSLAAAALTATSALRVGVGIMPAPARNPAVTAMEVATLCGLAPGRFHAGVGHGMPAWMAQIGAAAESPVTLLEETLVAVRRLLRGERVTVQGRYVRLSDVALDAPPSPVPPVSAGVRGPRSLVTAGRCADGAVLADFCSPAYVRSARALLAEGSGGAPRRVTVYASAAVDRNGAAMRQAMAPVAAAAFAAGFPSVAATPFHPEVAARAQAVGWVEALAAMPADWWRQIAPVGTPDDAAAYLEAIADAGADCVALFPDPTEPLADARALARDVIPLLGCRRPAPRPR